MSILLLHSYHFGLLSVVPTLKIFKIDTFVLWHVLDHSKSTPAKKKFRKIFDFLVIFCHFWAQKIDFLKFLGEILNFFTYLSRNEQFAFAYGKLYLGLNQELEANSEANPEAVEARTFARKRKRTRKREIFLPGSGSEPGSAKLLFRKWTRKRGIFGFG